MKKGQILEGTVERIKFSNKGIVRVSQIPAQQAEKTMPQNGEPAADPIKKCCIVKNVIPGQKIRFSVSKIRSGAVEGRLLEVLEKSPVEIDSPCRHFEQCGGCAYQNLPYEEQLKLKENQVKELLDSVLCKQIQPPIGGGSVEKIETEKEIEIEKADPGERRKSDNTTESGDKTEKTSETDAVSGYRFEGIKGSPVQFGYRNKMEFSFGDGCKDGSLELGMHKRGSFYDIVSVKDCQIVDEDYRKILDCTLAYFREKDVSFYHKLTHVGYLRHLLVRKAVKTGEILIDLITSSQTPPPTICMEEGILEDWRAQLLALKLSGKLAGILHTWNDSLADTVQNDKTDILYGQDYFYEELLGLKFRISPFSFFQTNSLGAEVLYETVREFVLDCGDEANNKTNNKTRLEELEKPADKDKNIQKEKKAENATGKFSLTDKVVYDLYSGTGTIAQLLAPVAGKVIGVEIVEEAVEAAKQNAELNGLHNCEFIAGDVLKVLDEIEEKPDFIVLDPPRDGIHPKALKKIISYGVSNIVYISCKPTSLVRDLEIFLGCGYEVVRACAIDQFPATGHVETVVLLSHKKPDSVINVKVEFGEGEGKVPLDKIAERAEKYKPKERVTYKAIKEYIEAKYGFKVHTAYIAEVKRDLGLPMYDAPNAVEELKQPRKHPTAEKVEAIKDALKYFKVI